MAHTTTTMPSQPTHKKLSLPFIFARLKPHLPFIAVFAVTSLIGQYVILKQTPLIGTFPDTVDYVAEARLIITNHQFFFSYRPPLYPLIIAILTGGLTEHFNRIVALQAFMMLVATFEIYVLTYRVSRQRLAACLVAVVMSLNIYILDWERAILTETLAYVIVVTSILLLERYIRQPRWSLVVGLGFISAAGILLRPSFIYLPAVLLAALVARALCLRAFRQQWQFLVVTALIAYGCVIGYMVGNEITNNYFGLSYVSNVNLFGKIIEYRMQDFATDPQFAQLRADTDNYLAGGNTIPWFIPPHYPNGNYAANDYAEFGAYSRTVLEHHPILFARLTIADIYQMWIAPPAVYTSFSSQSPQFQYVGWGATWSLDSYVLLPLLLLLFGVQVWRAPKDPANFTLFVMALVITSTIVIVPFDSYGEFYRLRSPFDGAMLVLAGVVLARLFTATSKTNFAASQNLPSEVSNTMQPINDEQYAPTLPRLSTPQLPRSSTPARQTAPGGAFASTMAQNKHAIIMGAGPAGLTAAYELVLHHGVPATVLEKDPIYVGGISRTATYHGNRFDIGGHRFFSKSQEVEDLWTEILGDELLVRPRMSRIFYRGKYFDYPLKATNALVNLGPFETARCISSYAKARMFPIKNPKTFEDWVTNEFGMRLFQIFFKTYTERVWGVSTSELSADWAAQRIKGLNMAEAIKNALFPPKKGKSGDAVIKTLIEEFRYPRFGPGEMWERVQKLLAERGYPVVMGQEIVAIKHGNGRVNSIISRDLQGNLREYAGSDFISTLPIRELIGVFDPALPPEVRQAANSLKYRDYFTVVLTVNKDQVFPDNWMYLYDKGITACRIQNYKNWSPSMVANPAQTCLGLEYFCFETDEVWRKSDQELIAQGTREIVQLGMATPDQVVDGVVVRMPKAYPIYDDEYKTHLRVIRDYLEAHVPNLQLVGRNGMHHYNNQDHSMMTALCAARNIATDAHLDPWSVNTDAEYHEGSRDEDDESGRQMPKRVLVTVAASH